MSDIQFDCPKCGHNLVVDGEGAGMSVPCPECNEQITIPDLAEPEMPSGSEAIISQNELSRQDAKFNNSRPSETEGDSAKTTHRRSVWRILATGARISCRSLAGIVCVTGWLVVAIVRKAILLPISHHILTRRYRLLGAFAYRDKIMEANCCDTRAKIKSIEEVMGASKSRIRNAFRRTKRNRLQEFLGKKLIEQGGDDPALSRHANRAVKTREYADRMKASSPKVFSFGSFSVGAAMVAILAIIACREFNITTFRSGRGLFAQPPTRATDSTAGSHQNQSQNIAYTPTSLSTENSADVIDGDKSIDEPDSSLGTKCFFVVNRRVDFGKFPALMKFGENVWEIEKQTEGNAVDFAFLVTPETVFTHGGVTSMWIREVGRLPIEDDRGFRREIAIYKESPSHLVQEYERQLEATRKRDEALAAAKRERDQAEAHAFWEKELAKENAQKEEAARKAAEEVIKYAAMAIPAAVKPPEIYLSKQLAAKGFVAKIHAPKHEALFKSAQNQDWAEVVRIVNGRIECRQDVDAAVFRLTSFKGVYGGLWRESWDSVPESISMGGSESWEVTIEIRSPTFTFEHEYVDYAKRTYIRILRLPATPERIVKITRSGLSVDVPYSNTSPADIRWSIIADNTGYLYRVPLGGSHVYILEYPWGKGPLESEIERIRTSVLALNQKNSTGEISAEELRDRGVQIAKNFYRFVSETIAPRY